MTEYAVVPEPSGTMASLRKFPAGNSPRALVIGHSMNSPETVFTESHRVSCDGATDIRAGAALGHPRVWLEIDEKGYVDCGYCDRHFVLKGGPADQQAA
jgi:uncharacterized Zn-finger protein